MPGRYAPPTSGILMTDPLPTATWDGFLLALAVSLFLIAVVLWGIVFYQWFKKRRRPADNVYQLHRRKL